MMYLSPDVPAGPTAMEVGRAACPLSPAQEGGRSWSSCMPTRRGSSQPPFSLTALQPSSVGPRLLHLLRGLPSPSPWLLHLWNSKQRCKLQSAFWQFSQHSLGMRFRSLSLPTNPELSKDNTSCFLSVTQQVHAEGLRVPGRGLARPCNERRPSSIWKWLRTPNQP